jgi:hypothetical protein
LIKKDFNTISFKRKKSHEKATNKAKKHFDEVSPFYGSDTLKDEEDDES